MPINPLKEFFKRKKAEVKFARAGPGQTLSSDATSSTANSSSEQSDARRAAADAAMKRFERSNPKPAQRPRMSGPEHQEQRATQTSSTSTSGQEPAPQTRIVQLELPLVDGIAQRSVQIYSTDELAQRIKQPEIDDDFFRLTVEDAKLFKQRYDEEKARNEILRTSEMRRREAEAKKPTSNVARLRFKLPNNMILEASFSGSEQFGLVRDWLIAACLEKAQLDLGPFDILFGLKPLKMVDFSKSVKQLGLIPATTLIVVQRKD